MRGGGRPRRDGSYVIDEGQLPVGSTLGGPDLCVRLKAGGAIESVHSTRANATLLAGLTLRHWSLDSGLHIERSDGVIRLRPGAQELRFHAAPHVVIRERCFVLDEGPDSPPCCYFEARITNRGDRPVRIASVYFARVAATMTGDRFGAAYDPEYDAFVVWETDGEENCRALVASSAPASWAITTDHARAVSERWEGPFDRTIDAEGSDPLAVLHFEHAVPPGVSVTCGVRVVALPGGRATAGSAIAELPTAAEARRRTRERYASALTPTQVLAPLREVSLGVRWAKANMLRVMRTTPTGRAFTNDPGNSSACVGRDAAWFVHGCDWLDPAFSLALLRGFAARQERDGKIVEWYDLRTGGTHDDGLDVNDNTPLFVIAVWHHAAATGDRSALAELYPAAARAGDQLLAHRDERGLIWCSARGTGARGIAGWRNIIDGYRISGATTEINSESYAAFRRLAEMAQALDRESEAQRWTHEADALHAAIERWLRNPENGLYDLCIDVDGRRRSSVTSDLVFPVIFGVCDDQTAARVVERLRQRDFWTGAGLRTVTREAPEYSPVAGHGLLGGVWVAVTFWYAFAAAKFFPEVMAEALAVSFAHYGRDPRVTNTVPGQFSEWLHGETLANRGMMLSPWFPPRYVWAAVEGACGLELSLLRPRIAPRIPLQWRWLAIRNVPYRGGRCTWIVVRSHTLRVYATGAFEADVPLETFERDVTEDVVVIGDGVSVVALEGAGRVVVFIGNSQPFTRTVALRPTRAFREFRPTRWFDDVLDRWGERSSSAGPDGATIPVTVGRNGYVLVELAAEAPSSASGIGTR